MSVTKKINIGNELLKSVTDHCPIGNGPLRTVTDRVVIILMIICSPLLIGLDKQRKFMTNRGAVHYKQVEEITN